MSVSVSNFISVCNNKRIVLMISDSVNIGTLHKALTGDYVKNSRYIFNQDVKFITIIDEMLHVFSNFGEAARSTIGDSIKPETDLIICTYLLEWSGSAFYISDF